MKISIRDLERELSPEEQAELEAAEQLQPVFDGDSPAMTAEQLQQFKRSKETGERNHS